MGFLDEAGFKRYTNGINPKINRLSASVEDIYTKTDNIFGYRESIKDTTLNGDGSENHSENALGYSTSDYLDIEKYAKISFFDTTEGVCKPLRSNYCLYDINKNCIQTRTSGDFEFPVNAKYLRFYYHTELAGKIVVSGDELRPTEYISHYRTAANRNSDLIGNLIRPLNAFDRGKAHVGYYITANHEVGTSTGKAFISIPCNKPKNVRFFYTSGYDVILFATTEDGNRIAITPTDENVYINTNSADRVNYDGNRFGWCIITLPTNTIKVEINIAGVEPQISYQTIVFDIPFPAKFTPHTEHETLSPTLNINYPMVYGSIALFEKWGVIGDSFSVGAIHTSDGLIHNNLSLSCWSILGRMTGTIPSIYAKGGLNTRTWLTDPNGLTEMLSDEPKDLYVIKLGINDAADLKDAYIGSSDDINFDNLLQSGDTYYGNMAKIVGHIKNHSPLAKIVIVSLPYSHTVTQSNYIDAQRGVANALGLPFVCEYEDEFFRSDYYVNGIQGYHPTAVILSGMAKAYDRLISKCFGDYYDYFKDFYK